MGSISPKWRISIPWISKYNFQTIRITISDVIDNESLTIFEGDTNHRTFENDSIEGHDEIVAKITLHTEHKILDAQNYNSIEFTIASEFSLENPNLILEDAKKIYLAQAFLTETIFSVKSKINQMGILPDVILNPYESTLQLRAQEIVNIAIGFRERPNDFQI